MTLKPTIILTAAPRSTASPLSDLLAAALRLPAAILLIGTVAAQTAAPLANPSFELPARAADQPGARPSI